MAVIMCFVLFALRHLRNEDAFGEAVAVMR